jgi:hypothetical protein
MLVAKRDPFHPGANDVSMPRGAGATKLAHVLSTLQMAGTLLAVPVGLGSAYSMYRANFSVEATCQSLRANIVAMLDRSVDANARHMLVRRDVEAFERSCGGVDPDATAAFKTLLAADKNSPPMVAPVATAVAPPPEAKLETAIRKIEARPAVAVKQPAVNPPVAEGKPTQRDLATFDAAWLGAVRQALVKHAANLALASVAAPAAIANPPAVAVQAALPVAPVALEKRSFGELRGPVPATTPPMSLAAPVPVAAPALPPATPAVNAPPPQTDADHPVPPSAIPESASPGNAAKADEQGRSRVRRWIAKIPLVNTVVENAWQ